MELELEPGHHLRHGGFDLQAGVHFEKEEIAPRVGDELARPRAEIPDALHDAQCHGVQLAAARVARVVREEGGRRRRLFDDLLVPALDAALAFAQGVRPALSVAKGLHLDVTGLVDVALEIHARVGERDPAQSPTSRSESRIQGERRRRRCVERPRERHRRSSTSPSDSHLDEVFRLEAAVRVVELSRRAAPMFLEPAVRDDQEWRLDDTGHDRERHGAPDDHDGERLLRLRSDPVRHGRREETDHRDERRHQARAQSLLGRLLRRALDRVPFRAPEALEIGDHEDRILDRDAEDRDEPHGGRHREVYLRDEEREHPARAGHRDVHENERGVDPGLDRAVRQERDEQDGQRDDDDEPTFGLVELVDLAAPLEPRVVRAAQLRAARRLVALRDLSLDAGLGLGDRADEVTPAHAELHRRVPAGVLPVDYRRSVDDLDVRELSERHLRAVGRRYGRLANGLEAQTVLRLPAHGQVEALLALVHHGLRLSADGGLDDRIDVAGVEAVARVDVAEGFWPESTAAGDVLVQGGYLVRTAATRGSTLALTGDTSAAGGLTVWAPSAVRSVTWNGQPVSVTS